MGLKDVDNHVSSFLVMKMAIMLLSKLCFIE